MRRLRSRRSSDGVPVDLAVSVGSLSLPNPIMTAAGTAGHGAELQAFVDLASLGAVVVKSLASFEWAGNTAPRVHQTPAGMINSVGLAGPGVPAWRASELPELTATGARVVASIWGRSVEEYAEAAEQLAGAPGVLAVEVNLSCPNLGGHSMFAHDPAVAADVIAAAQASSLPLWAKLSPNTDRLVEVAAAVQQAGADAVTLCNTVLGMVIDPESRRPVLDGRGGGLSGPAIHAVAVRAVYDCRAALPELPIVGVGGVASGRDAVELMMAGASAVQVGTATFADPRAVERIRIEVEQWCRRHGVTAVRELTGVAHG